MEFNCRKATVNIIWLTTGIGQVLLNLTDVINKG